MPPKRKFNSEKKEEATIGLATYIRSKKATQTEEIYTLEDFSKLSDNEFGRYAFSSRYKKIGHVVIEKDEEGLWVAKQYPLPKPSLPNLEGTPEVCQLVNICKITSGPETWYEAEGEGGQLFVSTRVHQRLKKRLDGFDEEESSDVAYFSEAEDSKLHRPAVTPKDPKLIFDEITGGSVTIKPGKNIKLDVPSLVYRENNSHRGLTQNNIMGRSAKDEYANYFEKYKDQHLVHAHGLFTKSIQADLYKHAESQDRPEWLHKDAFGLTHQNTNPQVAENLGAAPKWVNTDMMVLERTAKALAAEFENKADVHINSEFQMLHDSQIIGKSDYKVNVNMNGVDTRLRQEIYPLQEKPNPHRPSDLAQIVGIMHAELKGTEPSSVQAISCKEIPYVSKNYQPVPQEFIARTDLSFEIFELDVMTIIDLETTGLELSDKITELAMISIYIHPIHGIVGIKDSYTALADPGMPLSPEIIKLTKLTDEMLSGQTIDWEGRVLEMLNSSNYIVCHNSAFDRKVLERATPEFIQERIKTLSFGCTLEGINWTKKRFLNMTLEELNKHIGFIYTGHRALNDCWATLNLLVQVPGALKELVENIHTEKTLIFAINSAYKKSPDLRSNNFRYTDGSWYKYVDTKELPYIKQWLDTVIYNQPGISDTLPQINGVTAKDAYSVRVEPKLESSSSSSTSPERVSKLGRFAVKTPVENAVNYDASRSSASTTQSESPGW
jgi:DNA polymerase-3 subunit epsilon